MIFGNSIPYNVTLPLKRHLCTKCRLAQIVLQEKSPTIACFLFPSVFLRCMNRLIIKCVFSCIRYHYYGIAVKESSQYYDVMYSKKGAAWVNETGKKEVTKQTVAYSPRSKLGTLLPEFPNVKDLNLPASLPEEKVTLLKYSFSLPRFFPVDERLI